MVDINEDDEPVPEFVHRIARCFCKFYGKLGSRSRFGRQVD